MVTTRLSSKGQIVIPKWLRERYNWQAGDSVVVIDTGTGVLLSSERAFPPTTLDDVLNAIHYEGPAYSVERWTIHRGRRQADRLDIAVGLNQPHDPFALHQPNWDNELFIGDTDYSGNILGSTPPLGGQYRLTGGVKALVHQAYSPRRDASAIAHGLAMV